MPSHRATAGIIFAAGFAASLTGDACHVVSGTTQYLRLLGPTLWRSDGWFPFLVGGAVLATAALGRRLGLPRAPRGPRHAAMGICAVLALYALTALLRGQPAEVSVALCGGLALLVFFAWDPAPGTLLLACVAALLGPLVEIGFSALGTFRYTPGSDGLFGVAPWLPCLYFAAGSVAAGLWRAIHER